MTLSNAMKRTLLDMAEDEALGRKISVGRGQSLGTLTGICEPNKYPTVTTWALGNRGLVTTGQAHPTELGAPIWRLTEDDFEEYGCEYEPYIAPTEEE